MARALLATLALSCAGTPETPPPVTGPVAAPEPAAPEASGPPAGATVPDAAQTEAPEAGAGPGAAESRSEIAPVEPTAEDEADDEATGPPSKLHGSLSMRYRGQHGEGDSDRDLFALLDLEWGDETKDPWTATVVGRLEQDFNDDSGVFFSPADTFDSQLTAQLYEAHVDLRDVPSFETVSLGRQELVETPEWVRFDGFSAETKPGGAGKQVYGLYAGQTVHFWESSPEGDAVVGAWWIAQPWTGGRTRLDWMHTEDETVVGSLEDDLVAVQLKQDFKPTWLFQGDYSWLGGTPRDLRLAGTWNDTPDAVLVQGTYYELLSTQVELTEEFDPLTPTLFAQFPYRQGTLIASKSWDDDFDLEGGTDVRRVVDSNDVSDFNRDFERYHLTGTQHHVFTDGLSLGLTGEIWDSDGTSTNSWGLDATHEWSKTLRASIGTYYALFKNDFFAGEERDDVRTYYVAARYKTAARTTWTAGYDFENSSEGDFHTFRLGALWRF